MTFTFRQAVREDTPLIAGIAGPTKSGKTFSALRLAAGIARALGGRVAMINAEGKRGHQYADKFQYDFVDIEQPFSPDRYTEALLAMKKLKPAVGIIDSMSHMHDGPGGILEMHDTELQRLAGNATGRERDKYNWTAWIKPKKLENEFVYTMLGCDFPLILCFRAKEKIKIVQGKPPEDLGYRPIASERVEFETIFTLMLPPHSKGVPDPDQSEMRDPFDKLVDFKQPIDERLGLALTEWARGRPKAAPAGAGSTGGPSEAGSGQSGLLVTADQAIDLETRCQDGQIRKEKLCEKIGVTSLSLIPASDYKRSLEWISAVIEAREKAEKEKRQ